MFDIRFGCGGAERYSGRSGHHGHAVERWGVLHDRMFPFFIVVVVVVVVIETHLIVECDGSQCYMIEWDIMVENMYTGTIYQYVGRAVWLLLRRCFLEGRKS